MKIGLVVAAATAIMIGGLATAAHAEINSGALKGPQGCWAPANFNAQGLGYWKECPKPAKVAKMKKSKKASKK